MARFSAYAHEPAQILSFENSWELGPEFSGVNSELQNKYPRGATQIEIVVRVINAIANLRQKIHDDLRTQHPEWVLPNGESPICDVYEARFLDAESDFAAASSELLQHVDSLQDEVKTAIAAGDAGSEEVLSKVKHISDLQDAAIRTKTRLYDVYALIMKTANRSRAIALDYTRAQSGRCASHARFTTHGAV